MTDEKNQTILDKIKKGIKDAAQGKVTKKDFSKYLMTDEEWKNPGIQHGILLANPEKSDPLFDVKFKLCLVLDNQAWFTTQNVKEQWGDDWDDAPYEHNAGPPYEYHEEMDCLPYEIKKVYWDSDNGYYSFDDYFQLNTNLSALLMNLKFHPWIYTFKPGTINGVVDLDACIFAGTTLEEFKKLVDVYEKN